MSERPKLAAGFRFQFEPAQDAHVLLYPEGMVKLNQSAGEILKRCDGSFTVSEMVADLESAFGTQDLDDQVRRFLDIAQHNGWVVIAS
jgi:pyrroloquinoline quinone biosynthesis protein D